VATTTMTTVDNILKEVYEDGGINDQLQSEIVALTRIEKTSEGVTHEVGGKYVRFPVRTKRNHGIGARNENEALPIARTQSYASWLIRTSRLLPLPSIKKLMVCARVFGRIWPGRSMELPRVLWRLLTQSALQLLLL